MNRSVPPWISTGDEHSFAQRTILKRKPAIIERVLRENELAGPRRAALVRFGREIQSGVICDPLEELVYRTEFFEPDELSVWHTEIGDYVGKPWIGIPWYLAESMFYLHLLLVFGYYNPESGLCMVDPFQPSKDRELAAPGGGMDLARRITEVLDVEERSTSTISSLLLFSLWGNRVDLSNFYVKTAKERIVVRDRQNLLVDDLDRLVERLRTAKRIDFILDNCGSELACDLITVFHLLAADAGVEVHLHTKRSPFFVSDAMSKDVHKTIETFREAPWSDLARVGKALSAWHNAKRLRVREHHYWSGPRHFPDLPAGLKQDLARADLVLLKGDANYRRLLSDRKWPATCRMREIAAYFPTTFAALRTMKSEIAVDLTPAQIARLTRTQTDWMISGELGIVVLVEKQPV